MNDHDELQEFDLDDILKEFHQDPPEEAAQEQPAEEGGKENAPSEAPVGESAGDTGESTEEFCAEDSCPESGCGADPQSCESDPCCGCTAEDCRPGEDNEPTEEGDINASQR